MFGAVFRSEYILSKVQQITVDIDEADMRLDRWFASHFPHIGHGRLQKLLRKGEVRVDGKRAKTSDRLEGGMVVRVPPLMEDGGEGRPARAVAPKDAAMMKDLILFENADVIVLNKPAGLTVQGGPKTVHHIDGMLQALEHKGIKPRLVHRLDKDTAGCLVLARNRKTAAYLGETFRSRSVRKIYWALVRGCPKPKQGEISTWLRKEGPEGRERMVAYAQRQKDSVHAKSYYSVIDNAGQKVSWVSLKPVTGRTHQLRVQTEVIGHPILGDPKYGIETEWEFPVGLQNKLHLLARRIAFDLPDGTRVDVSAPLPAHMQQSFSVLGFDANIYDPSLDDEDED